MKYRNIFEVLFMLLFRYWNLVNILAENLIFRTEKKCSFLQLIFILVTTCVAFSFPIIISLNVSDISITHFFFFLRELNIEPNYIRKFNPRICISFAYLNENLPKLIKYCLSNWLRCRTLRKLRTVEVFCPCFFACIYLIL